MGQTPNIQKLKNKDHPNGGGNGAGCFEVKVWADTAKFTDVIVTRLRKCSDLMEAETLQL